MVIKLRVVQFQSEITVVNSNQIRAMRSFDFEITRMISDQVQLPLLIMYCTGSSRNSSNAEGHSSKTGEFVYPFTINMFLCTLSIQFGRTRFAYLFFTDIFCYALF